MKILFLGDVMGRSGRTAVVARICRGCAATGRSISSWSTPRTPPGGMGLTAAHATELLAAGADCLTLGDHAFDQREMLAFIEQEPRVLRPLNYAKAAPGHGARLFDTPAGARSWSPRCSARCS